MMGLPDWSNKERVERLGEYLEVLDLLLRQTETSYEGAYYRIDGAVMNPLPLQKPRPPIMSPRWAQRCCARQHSMPTFGTA